MFFKKNKKNAEDEEGADTSAEEQPKPTDSLSGNTSVEFVKIHAKLDGLDEARKASNERFTRVSEQIGEIRSMIADVNKSMGEMEVKTVKAVDMVEAVHPDKLMVEIRKQDGRIEALKANLESNELMMNTIVEELRNVRKQIQVFKGLEQVMKLNEEVKSEIMEIRKTKAMIERHADKVETVFLEVQKRFQDFSKYEEVTKGIEKDFKKITSEFDAMKIRSATLAPKKEIENITKKVDDFEKHAGNVVSMVQRKAEILEESVNSKFKRMDEHYRKRIDDEFTKTQDTHKALQILITQNPDLAKQLERIKTLKPKKSAHKDGIKPLGKDEPGLKGGGGEKEKKGFFARIFGGKKKGAGEKSQEKPKEAESEGEKKEE